MGKYKKTWFRWWNLKRRIEPGEGRGPLDSEAVEAFLRAHGEATATEIADALGRAVERVSRYLKAHSGPGGEYEALHHYGGSGQRIAYRLKKEGPQV